MSGGFEGWGWAVSVHFDGSESWAGPAKALEGMKPIISSVSMEFCQEAVGSLFEFTIVALSWRLIGIFPSLLVLSLVISLVWAGVGSEAIFGTSPYSLYLHS